jgi:hypothetical protein
MKIFFKNAVLGIFFIFAVASPVMAVATPQPVSAAGCEGRVLGIPPWYRGLTKENPPKCDLKSPNDLGGLSNYIWRIVLNGVEMAIVIVAYIAVFFLLYGGFLYLTGGALPAQLEKARKTITNAIIGLVIAMAAIALNNLIFGIIT